MAYEITTARFTAASGTLSLVESTGLKDTTVYRDSAGVYRLYTDSPSEDPATMTCHPNIQLPSGSTVAAIMLAPIEISTVDGGLTYIGYKIQVVNTSGTPVDADVEVVIERH